MVRVLPIVLLNGLLVLARDRAEKIVIELVDSNLVFPTAPAPARSSSVRVAPELGETYR